MHITTIPLNAKTRLLLAVTAAAALAACGGSGGAGSAGSAGGSSASQGGSVLGQIGNQGSGSANAGSYNTFTQTQQCRHGDNPKTAETNGFKYTSPLCVSLYHISTPVYQASSYLKPTTVAFPKAGANIYIDVKQLYDTAEGVNGQTDNVKLFGDVSDETQLASKSLRFTFVDTRDPAQARKPLALPLLQPQATSYFTKSTLTFKNGVMATVSIAPNVYQANRNHNLFYRIEVEQGADVRIENAKVIQLLNQGTVSFVNSNYVRTNQRLDFLQGTPDVHGEVEQYIAKAGSVTNIFVHQNQPLVVKNLLELDGELNVYAKNAAVVTTAQPEAEANNTDAASDHKTSRSLTTAADTTNQTTASEEAITYNFYKLSSSTAEPYVLVLNATSAKVKVAPTLKTSVSIPGLSNVGLYRKNNKFYLNVHRELDQDKVAQAKDYVKQPDPQEEKTLNTAPTAGEAASGNLAGNNQATTRVKVTRPSDEAGYDQLFADAKTDHETLSEAPTQVGTAVVSPGHPLADLKQANPNQANPTTRSLLTPAEQDRLASQTALLSAVISAADAQVTSLAAGDELANAVLVSSESSPELQVAAATVSDNDLAGYPTEKFSQTVLQTSGSVYPDLLLSSAFNSLVQSYNFVDLAAQEYQGVNLGLGQFRPYVGLNYSVNHWTNPQTVVSGEESVKDFQAGVYTQQQGLNYGLVLGQTTTDWSEAISTENQTNLQVNPQANPQANTTPVSASAADKDAAKLATASQSSYRAQGYFGYAVGDYVAGVSLAYAYNSASLVRNVLDKQTITGELVSHFGNLTLAGSYTLVNSMYGKLALHTGVNLLAYKVNQFSETAQDATAANRYLRLSTTGKTSYAAAGRLGATYRVQSTGALPVSFQLGLEGVYATYKPELEFKLALLEDAQYPNLTADLAKLKTQSLSSQAAFANNWYVAASTQVALDLTKQVSLVLDAKVQWTQNYLAKRAGAKVVFSF